MSSHRKRRTSTSTSTADTNTNGTGTDDGHLALELFDRFFPRGTSWQAWRVWVQAVFALPMTEAEAALFTQCTGRTRRVIRRVLEAWTRVGRRGGKSRVMAFCVAFLAAVRVYQLAPGERGIVMVIAPGKRQAAVILGYTAAFLRMIPGVVIARQTTEELELSTGITIAVQTASYRTPRGYTIVAAVIDEVAFLRSDDSANPDQEIVRALRPSLASVPGSLLLAISSPYAARGMLFSENERHYGRDDSDTLVWVAPTMTMNPTIAQRIVDKAMEEDPAAAAAEWGAEFRSDLESLFSRAALDACVVRGRYEIAPLPGLAYVGFLDPSGGSHDSFTLAIAHRDAGGRPVLDLLREVVPNFSPEAVCKQFAAELTRYTCKVVYSDNWGAEWPREQFAKHGIIVQPSPLNRNELYLEMVPMVNSGQCELLDHAKMLSQMSGLERRTGRSGRDSIDHRPNSHDDLSNAAAGCLVMLQQSAIKAPLPVDFTQCVNDTSTAAETCAFMSRGPNLPSDPYCRNYCLGWQAVRPLYLLHQQRASAAGSTEPVLSALDFLHRSFDVDGNSFVRRHATRKVMEQIEGAIGWG